MRHPRDERATTSGSVECIVLDSLRRIDAAAWNRLAGDHPALRHEFLYALEEAGCASELTGWKPMHLALRRDDSWIGAMPLYLKSHSYGEYVFDWAWAEAYRRHGLRYYPKLLCAVPFTPVTGPRILAPRADDRHTLIARAVGLAAEIGASSFHCLLPDAGQADELAAVGLMRRTQVQFHWHNRGYADFDGFLAAMNHEKRKKIRQERRKVREAGVSFEHVPGAAIGDRLWSFFLQCYGNTYRTHGSTPYLNLEFFRTIGRTMPDDVLLIVASRGGSPIAAALNLCGPSTLYGRYWGALEYVPGLHFETCYYQAIEHCIAHGIDVFEGGAQGEHKLARGFEPERTWSAHRLEHPEFASAVEDFLRREGRGIEEYIDELSSSSPFKSAEGSP
jgi:uncharacterized protein